MSEGFQLPLSWSGCCDGSAPHLLVTVEMKFIHRARHGSDLGTIPSTWSPKDLGTVNRVGCATHGDPQHPIAMSLKKPQVVESSVFAPNAPSARAHSSVHLGKDLPIGQAVLGPFVS